MSRNVPLRVLDDAFPSVETITDNSLQQKWFVEDTDTERIQEIYEAVPQQEAQKKAQTSLYKLLRKVEEVSQTSPVIDITQKPAYHEQAQDYGFNEVETTWFLRGDAMALASEVLKIAPRSKTADKARAYWERELNAHKVEDEDSAEPIVYQRGLLDRVKESRAGTFVKNLFNKTPVYQP